MLWVYHATTKHSSRLSQFHVAYGSETIWPTKFMVPASRTKNMDDEVNNCFLSHDKALLDDIRLEAMVHIMRYP